jgi:hypothetical protein
MSLSPADLHFITKKRIKKKLPLTVFLLSRIEDHDYTAIATVKSDLFSTNKMKCVPFYKPIF